MIRTLIIGLLLIPTASGFVTELGYEFVEVYGYGTLLIDDQTVNISGITVLTIAEPENLTCPTIPLSHEQANAYATGTLTLSFEGANTTIRRPDTQELSLNRCLDCEGFHLAEPTPCTIPTCAMTIETEPLQDDRIEYRIIAEEPYTYWIEDAFGTLMRTPAVSSTPAIKRYTPPLGPTERIFIVRAENACATAAAVVGFVEEPVETCEPARIETEPLHTGTITYRVIADEEYTYWIEDAWGEPMRAPSQSATASTKSYTPPSAPGDRVFIIYANTSCALSSTAVGIAEPKEVIEPCETLEITTEPVSEAPITYRIIAEEPYTYWIEDAYGSILREPAVSAAATPKSYTPGSSLERHAFVIRANTSCTARAAAVAYRSEKAEQFLCPTPVISAEPIQEERIRYRITSETPYAYSVSNLTHTLRSDTSTTGTIKQYTPTPNLREQIYIIRAENDCGETNLTIGFVSDAEHCPEPDASIVCSEHSSRIEALETQLDACTNPPEHMTSFYTLARTSADAYTYRSNARSNATFLACAARTTQREGDALTISFTDRELMNATPVLLALENGSVIDVRIATVPGFVGNRTIPPDEPTPEYPDEPEEEQPHEPTEQPVVQPPPTQPEPLRADPIRRAIRQLVNLIRTNRTVQNAEPWIMPVGVGFAGLMLLIPSTRRAD
ncbi:MAG: hypothetical protein ACMXYM_03125 [Candidatus Woesearchaeota archaeon]